MVGLERKRRQTRHSGIGHPQGTGPRIVVLDNDETTGSYGPLFDLLGLLKEREVAVKAAGLRLRELVPHLVAFCHKAGLFRPGLRDLLVTLWGLRQKGLLDAIVMYTYQSEEKLGSADALYDSTGQLISVPILLDYMFGFLATGCRHDGPLTRFFDLRIVRETHMRALKRRESSLGAKKISLVFNLLQRQPSSNLRGFVFIDDCLANVRSLREAGPLSGLSVAPYEFQSEMVASLGEAYLGLWNSLLRGLVGREEFGDFINQSIESCLEVALEGSLPVGCGVRGGEKAVYGQIDFAPLARRLKGHFVGLRC